MIYAAGLFMAFMAGFIAACILAAGPAADLRKKIISRDMWINDLRKALGQDPPPAPSEYMDPNVMVNSSGGR